MKFPDAVRDAHLLSGAECWRADAGESAWAEYGKDKIRFVTCVSVGLKGLHADADSILEQLERDKERQRLYGQKAHGGEGAMDEQGTGERRWRRIPREAFAKLLAQAGGLADGDKKHAAFGVFYYGFLTAWHGGEKGKNPVADFALDWVGDVSATYRANGRRGGRPQKATLPENGRVALQKKEERKEKEIFNAEKPKPKGRAVRSAGAAAGAGEGGAVSGISDLNKKLFRMGIDGRDKAAWDRARDALHGGDGVKEGIRNCPPELVPHCAVLLLGDRDRAFALNTYQKAQAEIGPRRFEDELVDFLESNKGAKDLGRAFVGRLKKAGVRFGKG